MGTRISISGSTSGGGGATPVGATLMKTGQTTSYRTGDDGDLEAGRATDFFTLAVNNPFGNTNRFTDELGGSTYANDIVIDWSTYDNIAGTVLGYYVGDYSSGRNYNDAIDWGVSLSVGTFTGGWRLVNLRELLNVCYYGLDVTPALRYPPFNADSGVELITSTTTPTATDRMYRVTANFGDITRNLKTSTTGRTMASRIFTVTGTTLT